jgi:4-amino-4-deoxy-L-arabinose transferase-like glycosyltransferase
MQARPACRLGTRSTPSLLVQTLGLGVIFLVGLWVRVHPIVSEPEQFRYGLGPFGDSQLYHRIAYNLYTGHGFSGTDDGRAFGQKGKADVLQYEPAIYRAPAYPCFLSAVYRLLGRSEDMQSLETWHETWNKVRIVQSALDALLCVLVFIIVRILHPASVTPAFVSAAVYCISAYNIYYTRAHLSESLTTFLLTSGLLLVVLALRTPTLLLWLLSGAAFGLTALSSPQLVLFPAVLCGYVVLLQGRRVSWSQLRRVALLMVGVILVIAPWTWRNHRTFGEIIPINAGSVGYNLFLGTFETAANWQGWDRIPEELFHDEPEKIRIAALQRSFFQHSYEGTIRVREPDRVLARIAVDWMMARPIQTLRAWVGGVPRLWFQDNIHIYRDREPSGVFAVVYFFLAAHAFLRGSQERRHLMAPVVLFIGYLTLIFVPLHVEARYSVSAMPGLIALAGIGAWELARGCRGTIPYRVRATGAQPLPVVAAEPAQGTYAASRSS